MYLLPPVRFFAGFRIGGKPCNNGCVSLPVVARGFISMLRDTDWNQASWNQAGIWLESG